ncbi:MAG TPA: DUF4157 domain-containing protein [Ilumatobacteraceae bacterium]
MGFERAPQSRPNPVSKAAGAGGATSTKAGAKSAIKGKPTKAKSAPKKLAVHEPTSFGAFLQPKLEVGPAHDPAEAEADRIAREVANRINSPAGAAAPATAHQHTGDCCNEQVVNRVLRKPAVGAEGGSVDADTERTIRSSAGSGQPLAPKVKARMESGFGADFSDVRTHVGPEATELNTRIQAKAFTMGNDVYFRGGMPDTSSRGGQELLAHELTHTIQQRGG